MKKFICVTTMILLLSACVGPGKFYHGPELPQDQVATYALWNNTGFFSSLQIYTMEINHVDLEAYGGIGGIPASGGVVYLKPGMQKIKVSFVDSQNALLPALHKMDVFAGWYEFNFLAKPNMYYAPIFSKRFKGEEMV